METQQYVELGRTHVGAGASASHGRRTSEGFAQAGGDRNPDEATTVIVLRAHYTMDVFAAIVAGVTADLIATEIAPSLDEFLRGLV